MKATAIIQARLGSSRLPGKVLFKLGDKRVLEHVVARALKAKSIKNVIVATSVKDENLRLVKLAGKLGVGLYRGSEEDVLDRYYQAAKVFEVQHIVRITADCPVIDPLVIDKVVTRYFEKKADYCSNTLNASFPDGEDVEVFSFAALQRAWKKAKKPSEREHVTPYLYRHPEMFRLVSLDNKINLNAKRWTLDRKEDYVFLKVLYKNLYAGNPCFGMRTILAFLKQHPKIEEINQAVVRNEGYLKSLKDDQRLSRKKKSSHG